MSELKVPYNPFPSYNEQNIKLHKSFENVVKANEDLINAGKRGMASDYAILLKKLKNIIADAHEQYSKYGKLSYIELNRFNRIKRLEEEINKVITDQYSPIRKRAIKDMEMVIENTYTGGVVAINAAAATTVKPEISGKLINQILSKPWSGVTPAERLYLRQKYLGVQLNSQIMRDSMGEGSTYSETVKNLEKIITKDFAGTARTVEDSAHQLQSDTQQQVIDRMSEEDIEIYKVWVTVNDNRVREAHDALDGQKVSADDMFEVPSGDYAGFKADGPGLFGVDALDINCRCYLVTTVQPKKKE